MIEYQELTVDNIDAAVVNTIELVVEGYHLHGRMNSAELLDRVEAYLGIQGWSLPSDMDDKVNKRLIAIARKHKRELNA